jgi:hypothetical protein
MRDLKRPSTRLCLLICSAAAPFVMAQTSPPAETSASPAAVLHDGRHDFDFEVGSWKAHVKRLDHRLAGSKDWDEYDGTVVTRTLPLLEGWNEAEMRVDSPTSHRRIELLAVRTYNPNSHQWSIYGADVKSGVFDPPQIGQFVNGHGEFYAQDMYEGRSIYIRFVWQSIDANRTHFEQAFSADGGKTWEVNWIYDGVRMNK